MAKSAQDVTGIPDIKGDLRRAIQLLDAAVILLEPAPRDPLYAYEHGAIFAVVSSARDAANAAMETWEKERAA
jgi:hypothetical protein